MCVEMFEAKPREVQVSSSNTMRGSRIDLVNTVEKNPTAQSSDPSLQHHEWRTVRFRFATRPRRIVRPCFNGPKASVEGKSGARTKTGAEAGI
jgi:hypothetical protein